MRGALNALREDVAEQLRQAGVNAVTGMESAQAARWRAAVAAVSLSKMVCASGGFQDYLGVRRDADGVERELYGREVELTLALDIFAPRDGGERACQEAAEITAENLMCYGAAGLNALEIQAGQGEVFGKGRALPAENLLPVQGVAGRPDGRRRGLCGL